MAAADDDEDVRLPGINPAAGTYQSHETADEIASASLDDLGIHSVAVASKKGGDGRSQPLAQLPALVLETRELVVRAAGNQVASHFQRRARILEEAAQPDPVEAADLQERKLGRDAISLAPTVVRGFDETFVATRKFRKIAQEQLTDGSPPLQRVGDQAIDNEMVDASSKGSDSDTNRPLSGCWWGRRPGG